MKFRLFPDPTAEIQGEGDYRAAHRYRESVERFVETADIDEAAHQAAPESAAEARELEDAEAEGKAHIAGGSDRESDPSVPPDGDGRRPRPQR